MELDERIINYMKVRNEYAKTVANVAAAQLFSVASFYCMYALYSGGVFYSGSLTYAKFTILAVMILISVSLCVVNVFTVMKAKKVYIRYPDTIATRSGEEVIREAYVIARPVLIQKITGALLVLPFSVLVYIMLINYVSDEALANVYGKIVVMLGLAVFVSTAFPCIDRINCYRKLLNEIHVPVNMDADNKKNTIIGYVFGIAVPVSVCIWSLMRFYSMNQSLAWVTFPIALLLVLAVSFLVGWTVEAQE